MDVSSSSFRLWCCAVFTLHATVLLSVATQATSLAFVAVHAAVSAEQQQLLQEALTASRLLLDMPALADPSALTAETETQQCVEK